MINNPQNFIKQFTGEDGLISDWNGYHRALALAMNPDKFAKFFMNKVNQYKQTMLCVR